MPWSARPSSSLRLEFAEAAARGLYTMAGLCARYGVSRRVGYKWLARYQAEGAAGLLVVRTRRSLPVLRVFPGDASPT